VDLVKKIILASSSPRRKDLLSKFELDFEIMSSNIIEKVRDDEAPEQIVMALAFEKAIDICKKIDKNAIIIAADTIVYKDKVLGKPKNYTEAFNMLMTLQNSVHYVYSGLAILENNSNLKILTYEKTMVKIKKLSKDKINRYIESGEVWDKAGAYGIQGQGGAFIEWIKGDYYNVVGLPICKLDDILDRHFNISML
jgi:septum formation protein